MLKSVHMCLRLPCQPTANQSTGCASKQECDERAERRGRRIGGQVRRSHDDAAQRPHRPARVPQASDRPRPLAARGGALLAACGGGDDDGGEAAPPAEPAEPAPPADTGAAPAAAPSGVDLEGITIKYAKAPHGEDEAELTEQWLQPFKDATGAEIEHTIIPWDQLEALYTANFAGDDVFDVMYQVSDPPDAVRRAGQLRGHDALHRR